MRAWGDTPRDGVVLHATGGCPEAGSLAAELQVFGRLGRHPNLTRLIAVIFQGERVTHLVAELAPMGSLDGVLCKLEEDGTLATNEVLLECTMQIVCGMAHLAEMGIVHRDLALRNVLCFSFDRENRYEVKAKITDYGMAKEGGYVRLTTSSVGGGLPFRWMSPEAILRHSWSVKSDVWAFGVTMSVPPPVLLIRFLRNPLTLSYCSWKFLPFSGGKYGRTP